MTRSGSDGRAIATALLEIPGSLTDFRKRVHPDEATM